MSYLIDTHCHLEVRHKADDLTAILTRAENAGVGKIVWVGIDPEDSENALKAASAYPALYASVGVHPHNAVKWDASVMGRFTELASNPKVIAIGETGLDYFRDHSPRERQYEAFNAQCELACRTGLPVIIHSREAPEETWDVVSSFITEGLRGTFHCYAYDLDYASRVLEAGFYISVNGIMTYPKSTEVREMVRHLPVDRLLIETDAPFLLPQRYRHMANEPAFLVEVFKKLAEILGIDELKLKEQLKLNTEACFPRLKKDG